MRNKHILAALGAGVVLVAASTLPVTPRLLWNRTESVPRGLYLVVPKSSPERDDLVAFQPSDEVRFWLESRRYTGRDWPLLKRISGLEGDTICRENLSVFVNGEPVAQALETDLSGRELPVWQGCFLLRSEEVFLLAEHPRSLDGRYLGMQHRDRILGRAVPIWTGGNAMVQAPAEGIFLPIAPSLTLSARRARLRGCHPAGRDQRSAHLFPCDTGPESHVTPEPQKSDD